VFWSLIATNDFPEENGQSCNGMEDLPILENSDFRDLENNDHDGKFDEETKHISSNSPTRTELQLTSKVAWTHFFLKLSLQVVERFCHRNKFSFMLLFGAIFYYPEIVKTRRVKVRSGNKSKFSPAHNFFDLTCLL
jgi:hypothetical protein